MVRTAGSSIVRNITHLSNYLKENANPQQKLSLLHSWKTTTRIQGAAQNLCDKILIENPQAVTLSDVLPHPIFEARPITSHLEHRRPKSKIPDQSAT